MGVACEFCFFAFGCIKFQAQNKGARKQTADSLFFHADFLSRLHDSMRRKKPSTKYMPLTFDFHPTRNKKRKKLAFIGYASWQDLKPISFYSCRSNVDPMSIQCQSNGPVCVSQRGDLRQNGTVVLRPTLSGRTLLSLRSYHAWQCALTLREPNKLNKHSFNKKETPSHNEATSIDTHMIS